MSKGIGLSSMLFVPGAKPERFAKALASDADVVCIDLEDSVAASGKGAARAAAIASIAEGDPRLILRINGMMTRAGLEDLLALADAARLPELLFVPMVESAAEIAIVISVLGDRAPGIVPLIETVKGLDAAREIATAPGVVAMMFGGGDFAAELGVMLAWEPLRTARSLFVMACASAGVPAIDVPFVALDDEGGLHAEAAAAKSLGFAGKAAIHPAQIPAINAAFRSSPAEIAEAEAAQAAFDAAGGAAVRFNGRMLEAPIMRRYQRILAMRSKQDA
ncbi:MAG: CoA ester lyase [Candidatus Sphingomonas colombiensis]|nr:CoA ester lyase [Sphingomonas sp.]WEK42189.1 MAG: CoA ester lyase [Sphingomonas sp.]